MSDLDTGAHAPHPYRITVVCLGNICRSPMGEAVLRSRLADAGLSSQVVVDSAGTGDWNVGQGADPRALATLDEHGYLHGHAGLGQRSDPRGHRARQISSDWFEAIDLVLAMDEVNYADLRRMIARSGAACELRMMRSFDPELSHLAEPHPDLAVPDPYYGRQEGFDEVLLMIERAVDGLVASLAHRTSDST